MGRSRPLLSTSVSASQLKNHVQERRIIKVRQLGADFNCFLPQPGGLLACVDAQHRQERVELTHEVRKADRSAVVRQGHRRQDVPSPTGRIEEPPPTCVIVLQPAELR